MDSPEQSFPEVTRATRAHNIRSVWEALLAPNWTKDDLIDLGKAIFARTPLKHFDQAKFDRILPHLSKLAEVLESNIVPLSPSGPTGLTGPGPCPIGPVGPVGPAGVPDTPRPTGPANPGPCPTGPARPTGPAGTRDGLKKPRKEE